MAAAGGKVLDIIKLSKTDGAAGCTNSASRVRLLPSLPCGRCFPSLQPTRLRALTARSQCYPPSPASVCLLSSSDLPLPFTAASTSPSSTSFSPEPLASSSPSPAPQAWHRRQAMAMGWAAMAAVLLTPASALRAAAAEQAAMGSSQFELFEDTKEAYSFLVPQGWERGDSTVGTRRLVAFHPADDTRTNVSLLITPLSADFTSLGSFGTADNFGETLVNGMDRSWQKKPGQAAKLIRTANSNGLYVVEYTLQKPGEPKLHLVSAVGVGFRTWYNQLYTLTGQYLDDEKTVYGEAIDKAISSFQVRP